MAWELIEKVRVPFPNEVKSWELALNFGAYGFPPVDTGKRLAYARADYPIGYRAETIEEVSGIQPRVRKGKLRDFFYKYVHPTEFWGMWEEV